MSDPLAVLVPFGAPARSTTADGDPAVVLAPDAVPVSCDVTDGEPLADPVPLAVPVIAGDGVVSEPLAAPAPTPPTESQRIAMPSKPGA